MSSQARRNLSFCILALTSALACCAILAVVTPDEMLWAAYFGFWGVVSTCTFVSLLDDLLADVWR